MRIDRAAAKCALLLALGLAASVHAAGAEPPGGTPPANGGFDGAANSYDEVIRDLIVLLNKDPQTAQDAAVKLGRLGKHAMPFLVDLVQANYGKPNGDFRFVYYAACALCQVKSGDAVRPLVPILADAKVQADLRKMILNARGLELCSEAVDELLKIAKNCPDVMLRKEAFGQLIFMPKKVFSRAEAILIEALSDPDTAIRFSAARQCYMAKVYVNAIPRLIQAAETDADESVRINAVLALNRMNAQRSVPVLVRMCLDEKTSPALHTQVMNALRGITGVALKDVPAVRKWWAGKYGEEHYAQLEAALNEARPAAQTGESGTPAVPAPNTPALSQPPVRP